MMYDFHVLFWEGGVAHKSFLEIFTQSQHIFFRPVGHVFLKTCHVLFQDNPIGYHAANLFLFWVICYLFYKIAFKITKNFPLALLTSLFYSVHPLNNMLVNYITASVIATFVLMLQISFLSFLYYVDSEPRSSRRLMLSLVFFILSLFSHEMSMVLPLVVLAYAFFMKELSWSKALRVSLPFWIILGMYLIFRMKFFSLEGNLNGMLPFVMNHPLDYIATVMKLVYWYVSKLFYPRDFVFLWSVSFEDPYFKYEWARLLGMIVVAAYLLFVKWKKGIVAFALVLFMIGLLPTAMASFTHFPFVDPMIEPHWFYFSSIGFFMLVAYVLLKIKDLLRNTKIWPGLGVVLVVALLGLLHENNRHWKTQESYCRYWLSFKLTNATPDYWLGKTLLKQNNYAEAIRRFKETIRKNRYASDFVLADLGYAYLLQGERNKALENLKFAIRRNPKYSVSWFYLGVLYFREGQWEKSFKAFQKAYVLYPQGKQYKDYLLIVKNKLTS
jgi:tetratricopeptide (TPR) repeat protein